MTFTFTGTVYVEIICAEVDTLLADICHLGVTLRQINHVDSLTVRLQISSADILAVKSFATKRGGSFKIIHNASWDRRLHYLSKRPCLVFGFVMVLFLVFWVPTRVLFITVEGNEEIPSRHIIEQADLCGISFGASRRNVRSEKMKNSLLAAIPSLQWAGINTNGCTAIISVRERTNTEEEAALPQVSSIVAARDGIIESCVVQKGNPLCKIGQAVKSGDVLISAYTDCGIKINATRADGEIFAQTRHTLTVFTPTIYRQKGNIEDVERRYSILIGKKRINFYKGSGILGTSCDKIAKTYNFNLPGGFQLPFALLVTTISRYDDSMLSASAENMEALTCAYAKQYLTEQMISGRILKDNTDIQYNSDVCVLSGEYICSEMIGRVQNEETIGNYGEDHGENR